MKLFSIIRTFDKKQWSSFLTYVELYHKPNSVISKIVEWLDTKSIWKGTKQDETSAEVLLSEIPFEIRLQTFSNALAILGNLAEEYIGWMVWKDSPNLKRSCQLQGLAQKSLSDEYLKTQKEVFKKSENKVISIWDDFYKMRTLFNDYYFGISPSEDNHTSEFKDLVLYFRKSTAKIAQILLVEVRNREKLVSESWLEHDKFFTLVYDNNTELKDITDQLILMNSKREETAYKYLSNLLMSEEIHRYSKYIQFCIVTYSINYLNSRIKKGQIDRAQELLDLYEYAIEKRMYTLNDTIDLRRFINIIGIAAKLKNYRWARNLVDNWAHKVDEKNASSMAKFGHATIDFHQENYIKVVNTLSQMRYSNFNHRLRSRWLLLMAQYEINIDYIEVVKVQVDNFRRFVISNESKINKTSFEGLKASIKILNMLLNRKKANQAISLYEKSKYVFDRKWILRKIKNPAS